MSDGFHLSSGPSPAVAGIVHGYTAFAYSRAAAGMRRREVAQDKVTVILLLGSPLSVAGPGEALQPVDSFVAPLAASFAVTEDPPAMAGIQIDLTPIGAAQLLGMPLSELAGPIVTPLADVIGAREIALLCERLASLRGWEERVAAVDAWIAKRVAPRPPGRPDLAWMWALLVRSRGTAHIGTLADSVGCSRRHVERVFGTTLGVTPKTAARLVRFQRAVSLVGDARFADVAGSLGFADQAHLNREFRALAGVTPLEYVRAVRPDGLGIAA